MHSTCELAFANSAYLSELWAVKDLVRIKNADTASWSKEKEGQLQDEVRHARLLLGHLKQSGSPVVLDVEYSMQDRLYKPYVDLSKSATAAEAAVVHDLTEHRATWIYKTYIRNGRDANLIAICEQILKDEKQHFAVNAGARTSDLLRDALKGIDREIFRSELPNRYGRVMLFSEEFWVDYYQGARAEADAALIASFQEPFISGRASGL